MNYRFAVTVAALLVASCGGADKRAEGERKSAAGDVLGGSISDAMLPLDSVTSQSPPLREANGGPGNATPAAKAPERGKPPAATPPASPNPAEDPGAGADPPPGDG